MNEIVGWKEISRRRLTREEAEAYIAGKLPTDPNRSFDTVVVTTIKKNPDRWTQITYERLPYDPNGQQPPFV